MAADMNLIANVELSAEEAASGCSKEVFVEGMQAPVTVYFPAGTVSGRAITVNNVSCIEKNGLPSTKTLYVAVWAPGIRQKRKIRIIPVIAAVLVVLGLLAGIRYLSDAEPNDVRFYRGEELDPVALFPHYEERYYLNSLDHDMQQAACLIYEAVSGFKNQCTLPHGIDKEEFELLLLILRVECPELFQLDISTKVRFYYDIDTNEVYSAYFQYDITKDVYETRLAECRKQIATLAELVENMTDAEKEKYIFDYLAMRTYYDAEFENAGNAYGALIDRKAKCDGISLAMKWCMEEVGVQCLCILGDPREGDVGHAWNMVRLDGQYYNVDLTDSMRYPESSGNYYSTQILYPLYNVSDQWLDKDYIVSEAFSKWADKPVCDTDLQSYYAQNNLLYPANHSVETMVGKALKTAYQTKQGVSFQMYSDEDYALLQERMESIVKQWLPLNYPGEALTVEWAFFGYNVVWVRVV